MVVLGGRTACSESVISTYKAWLLKYCSVKCLGMSLTSGMCVIRLGMRLTASMCCRMQHAVPRHDWARQSSEGFVRHTKPKLCFAMAVDDHARSEIYCVPCCLRKQRERVLDRQVSQMPDRAGVGLYLRSLIERHHKRASDLKLNGTCNLQQQHSLCDKGTPNVYPHRCCITPVRLQCLLAESRHWMEKELVPELAAECAFDVSAESPGFQNRLQMSHSCTRCRQRA